MLSQRCFIDPFAEGLSSPTACKRGHSGAALNVRRRPTSGSPARRKNRSRSLTSTGTLMTQCWPRSPKITQKVALFGRAQDHDHDSPKSVNLTREFTAPPRYDARRGVTKSDLMKRKKMLQDNPQGRWQQNHKDLPADVNTKLETAFIAGELICGLWDNGLFRDFDLAKMQEIPGCKQLSRVGPETRPKML